MGKIYDTKAPGYRRNDSNAVRCHITITDTQKISRLGVNLTEQFLASNALAPAWAASGSHFQLSAVSALRTIS